MKNISRSLKTLFVLTLSFQLAACGTLMHPDREGQHGGRLDVGVVLLDGIGLFFFIIPGLIAYAVDFSNGTIYLPGGRFGGVDRAGRGYRTVRFDPKHSTPQSLAAVIFANTGCAVDWRDPRLQAIAVRSTDELNRDFARVETASLNRIAAR